ncbi:hypothetical protein [Ralstonia phage RP13]|nr:hypothetical protein [Ralstonia phage RP13]
MRVSIERVESIREELRRINVEDLANLEWYDKDGYKIVVPPEVIEEWKFTGLGNTFFLDEILAHMDEWRVIPKIV